MQTCEEAIVTLCLDERDFRADMELPVFVTMEELLPKLLETLKLMQPRIFGDTYRITLRGPNGELRMKSTLASSGIWDGACLELVRG